MQQAVRRARLRAAVGVRLFESVRTVPKPNGPPTRSGRGSAGKEKFSFGEGKIFTFLVVIFAELPGKPPEILAFPIGNGIIVSVQSRSICGCDKAASEWAAMKIQRRSDLFSAGFCCPPPCRWRRSLLQQKEPSGETSAMGAQCSGCWQTIWNDGHPEGRGLHFPEPSDASRLSAVGGPCEPDDGTFGICGRPARRILVRTVKAGTRDSRGLLTVNIDEKNVGGPSGPRGTRAPAATSSPGPADHRRRAAGAARTRGGPGPGCGGGIVSNSMRKRACWRRRCSGSFCSPWWKTRCITASGPRAERASS